MKAVVCEHAELDVEELPEPTPGRGQARLKVLRCGICGSDLHQRKEMDEQADLIRRIGYDRMGRSDQPVVFGHEFSGEVAEYGPGKKGNLPTGTPVVALPILRSGEKIDPIGLTTHSPGAYAEQLVVEQSMMMPVPNGLSPEVAALTEPLAVAWHAVRRGEVGKKQVAIVIGCGPIGLGIILMLKASGVRTVVASDYSAARRSLATACGADITVDPAEASPYTAAGDEHGHIGDMTTGAELLVDTHEKVNRLPFGWWHAWRLVDRLGIEPKRPVIFECVGVPGVIEDIIEGAPLFSRVVVAGVCNVPDSFRPVVAVNKEIELRFALAYSPLEFRDTLHMMAEGKVDPRPLITGEVGFNGVDAAFEALGDPKEKHAKILIDPRSSAKVPSKPAAARPTPAA